MKSLIIFLILLITTVASADTDQLVVFRTRAFGME